MFTGIIEELGTVVSVEQQGGVYALTISGGPVMKDVESSFSMAVNGVCLTVVRASETGCVFEVIPETLRRTNIGDLEQGDSVNLERPLAANGRLDGHIVQGHVDGTATVLEVNPDGESLLFDLEASSRLPQRESTLWLHPSPSASMSSISHNPSPSEIRHPDRLQRQ